MAHGWLVLQGWDGVSRTRVDVVGTTPTRYRIRAVERTRLGGRSRWLDPGAVALVPKGAIRDNCERCAGTKGGVPGNENRVGGRVLCDDCSVEVAR